MDAVDDMIASGVAHSEWSRSCRLRAAVAAAVADVAMAVEGSEISQPCRYADRTSAIAHGELVRKRESRCQR